MTVFLHTRHANIWHSSNVSLPELGVGKKTRDKINSEVNELLIPGLHVLPCTYEFLMGSTQTCSASHKNSWESEEGSSKVTSISWIQRRFWIYCEKWIQLWLSSTIFKTLLIKGRYYHLPVSSTRIWSFGDILHKICIDISLKYANITAIFFLSSLN